MQAFVLISASTTPNKIICVGVAEVRFFGCEMQANSCAGPFSKQADFLWLDQVPKN